MFGLVACGSLQAATPLPVNAIPAAASAASAAGTSPAGPSPSPSSEPTLASPAVPTPSPAIAESSDELSEVVVQTNEPKFVAPTRRDRIGRIWAPVLIDGKGPYRLVLDTGANRSAITSRAAQLLGIPTTTNGGTLVTGFTGSAMAPTIHAERLEVGDLLMGPTEMPVLPDVFGGAQGVLGIEGLQNKRIVADFTRDYLEIGRSHGERARPGFTVVPLKVIKGGLLIADVRVGTVRTKAIVDTGAQGTVGNLALREALLRHPPRDARHEDIIGVSLDIQSGDNLPLPDLDFGRMKVQGVRILFGDMYLFQHWKLTDQPTMTLGMDLLGSFDVLIIDYNRQELQIRPRNGPTL
ncbi:MAG: aspartyl protease family protein [Gammaproteobacteria bacterium]|nr:aspartyl protease family protein [Gammaproteobacteria bacterium]